MARALSEAAGVPRKDLCHNAQRWYVRPRGQQADASGPETSGMLRQRCRHHRWLAAWALEWNLTSLLPDTRRARGLVRLCLRACPCLACRTTMQRGMLRGHEKWNEWRRGALGLAWACSWLCLNSPVDVSCGPTGGLARSLPIPLPNIFGRHLLIFHGVPLIFLHFS